MRHLSDIELETFKRGQAAGLIPPETPVPADEKAVDELIFHIGIMETADIGYHNRSGKLHVMRIATFTSEHLEHVIHHLSELRPDEVRSVTPLRETVYLPMLESLFTYFAFGPAIVSEADLNGRLALNNGKITKSQILKGFAPMEIINRKKFASLDEIAACLNSRKSENTKYRIPELAVAWADTRAKYYQATGKKVDDGVHFTMNGAELLLSMAGCLLVEEFACVDGHSVPIVSDGAAELFGGQYD